MSVAVLLEAAPRASCGKPGTDGFGTLTCSYTAALPDATDRTNTASATLQNTPSGTTDFSSDPVDVSFANATRTEIDGSVRVDDSLQGSLGTVGYADAPVMFNYLRTSARTKLNSRRAQTVPR